MDIITIKSENGFDQNSYLVYDENNMVLIDCGFNCKRFENILDEVNLKDRNLDAVILTHTHFDHTFSITELVKNHNCKIYLHKNCIDFLFDKIKNASCYFCDFEPTPLNNSYFVEVEDHQNLSFGNLEFEIFFTPGHSICSICILLKDILFCGDTVLLGSVGRTDLFGGTDEQLYFSLKKLEKINFKTAHPGHGEKMSKEMVLGIINMFS